jgi:hypothetical protein
MAININKTEEDLNYYYTSEGNQYGPFNLVQLIPKINGDTMVWREGIEWTNANKLDELKKFFPLPTSTNNEIKTKVVKSTNNNDQKVDMYIVANSKFFDRFQLAQIRERLLKVDDSKLNLIQSIPLKDPQTSLIISIFVGVYGVDRFYIGDTGMGIGKLLTCGGLGIWAVVDWFQIQTVTRKKNFEKIQPYLY